MNKTLKNVFAKDAMLAFVNHTQSCGRILNVQFARGVEKLQLNLKRFIRL